MTCDRNAAPGQADCNSSGALCWISCPVSSWRGRFGPRKAMSSFSICASLMGLRIELAAYLWRRGPRQVSRKPLHWWVTISPVTSRGPLPAHPLSLSTLKVTLCVDWASRAAWRNHSSSSPERQKRRGNDLQNMDLLCLTCPAKPKQWLWTYKRIVSAITHVRCRNHGGPGILSSSRLSTGRQEPVEARIS